MGAHPFALFAKRRGLFPSHVGAGALTRPGGDFFRAVEQNLLSHTCHSEERRDESLLSNTCHSESASAVRNLLFAGVPLDKSEGVVKTEISWAVREHRFFGRAVREHPNIVEIPKRTKQSLFFTGCLPMGDAQLLIRDRPT